MKIIRKKVPVTTFKEQDVGCEIETSVRNLSHRSKSYHSDINHSLYRTDNPLVTITFDDGRAEAEVELNCSKLDVASVVKILEKSMKAGLSKRLVLSIVEE